jgi:hypothetical protein
MPSVFTRSESSTQKAIGVAVLLLFAASPAHAQSGSARYRFTTVLDSQDGLVPNSNNGEFAVFDPSLNILGRVAFTGFKFVGDTRFWGFSRAEAVR